MDRHLTGANKTRRLASIVLGSLAIIALAASPALAHAKIGNADTVRHNLLASELVGADDTEVADLESLLDTEDANDQDENVDEVDGPDDQGGQGKIEVGPESLGSEGRVGVADRGRDQPGRAVECLGEPRLKVAGQVENVADEKG